MLSACNAARFPGRAAAIADRPPDEGPYVAAVGRLQQKLHESYGLGGYRANVFEKEEEMQGIAW